MIETSQPQWFDPITDLNHFRDLATRIVQPFRDFPRPEGRLHAVLGGAGMGKTSLLNVLPDWLRQSNPVRSGQRLVPVLIEYRQEPDLESAKALLLRLVQQLREGVRRDLGMCTIAEGDFDSYFEGCSPAEGFRSALTFLLKQAQQASLAKGRPLRDVRLIGLVDDAEKIAHLTWAPDLFRQLRGLYARTELVSRCFDLVLAGEDRLARYFKSDASWADGRRVALCPMTPEVVLTWAREASEGQLSPKLAQDITAEGGGHPFLMRYFIHEIHGQAEQRQGWDHLWPDVVSRLAERFVKKHSDMLDTWARSLWQTDPQVTWSTYRLLADAGDAGMDVYGLEDRLEDLGLQPDVEQTLERLVWQGVVSPMPDEPYRYVAKGVFRRYFQEEQPAPEPLADETSVERVTKRRYPAKLREILTTRFNEEELRTLCFDFDLVPYQ